MFFLVKTGCFCCPFTRAQAGPASEYAPHLDSIAEKLVTWSNGEVKLLFALTSPMLNNVATDTVVLNNNKAAKAIMDKYKIPTIDLHQPIIDKCGQVPQPSCFNHTGCWSPHCPPGYSWLANSTVAPAIKNLL